ncbi:MAG: thiol peroxidase [Flavobacteriaceae bacterium]|nr:thiol peroxidase [Flavobacteriaceae bacterium]
MADITLGGTPVKTLGTLPNVGSKANDFSLTAVDLSTKSLADYYGKNVVLNIFPSVDTGTCAASVRAFNKKAADLDNTVVICVSRDLPFAQSRFCGAEDIENVEILSDFNTGKFGKDYNLEFADGPFTGLHSRAIVVIDTNGVIKYTQQVQEVADEPDYEAALKAI